MNRQVLLLGGEGFIGRALASRLRSDGVPVLVIGRADVNNLPSVLPTCSTVIHLASSTTPSASSAKPHLEESNLVLTRHLVECLKVQPKTHLIYFSSGGTVYGNPARLPVVENDPLAPLSPYGLAKVAQETMCEELRAAGRAVTILRPSNAYGPGQSHRKGFGLVRNMLEHASLGTSLEIWGDGENVRDFVYIDDIVEATLRLVQLPMDRGIYNLGSGIGYSVNQVRNVVEAACGIKLKTESHPARGIDVRGVVLDISCLTKRLGWQPVVGLAQGVTRTLDWFHGLQDRGGGDEKAL